MKATKDNIEKVDGEVIKSYVITTIDNLYIRDIDVSECEFRELLKCDDIILFPKYSWNAWD